MLPHETLHAAPPSRHGAAPNASSNAHQSSSLVSGGDAVAVVSGVASSLLARPHSQQQHFVSKASKTTVRGLGASGSDATRAWSPPRLKHDSIPSHASASLPQRSSSPQQQVRTLGHAILNPQTVFTSTVTKSFQTLRVDVAAAQSLLSPSKPNQSKPLHSAPSPARHSRHHDSTLHVSSVVLGTSSAIGGQLSTVYPQSESEVYGMEALRLGYGTTSDAVAPVTDGCLVEFLLPSELPAPDLRKLELSAAVPRHGLDTVLPPRISLTGSADIHVDLPLAPGAATCDSAVRSPVTLPRFVVRTLDVQESHLDRAIEYVVTVDVPELFLSPPAVDAATGDLSFTPNPLASGASKCRLVAADYAMIQPNGTVTTSSELSFTVTINRVKGGAAAGGNSSGSAAMNASAHGGQSSQSHRVLLATQGDFAQTIPPEDLLKLQEEAQAVSFKNAGAAPRFVFPAANPHELRFDDVLQANNLFIARTPSRSGGEPLKPKLYRPCYDTPLTDLEIIRLGRTVQEWDRLMGEKVKEEARQQLELKLLEKIQTEEAKHGDGVELCPLLLRLAQIYMSQGAKRQGSVVELLERIARIRLRALGIQSFEELDALAGKLLNGSSAGLNVSMTGSTTVLGGSMLSSAAAALESDDAAAAQVRESKKFDNFHQSLLLLSMYLKFTGRYAEALDFATYALKGATAVHGDGSLPHLRSMSEVAEAHVLLGNYAAARELLDMCIARSEVLFGVDGHATHNLVHTLGVCLLEEREYSKSVACHDRVLRGRIKRSDPAENLSLAESYLLAAGARVRMTPRNATIEERITEYSEAAVGILLALDPKALSPAMIVGKAGLLLLAARICNSRGDTFRHMKLLQQASDEVSSYRGIDSLEAALVSVPYAAAKLAQVCEGWDVPVPLGAARANVSATEATSGDADGSVKGVGELQLANSILLNVLGHQHPYTLRCSVLVAECRMHNNPQQSAETIERCLVYMRRLLHRSHVDHITFNRVAAKIHLILRLNPQALVEAATAHTVAVELNCDDEFMVELEVLLLGAMSRSCELPSPALVQLLQDRAQTFMLRFGETSETLVAPLQNVAEAHFLLGDFARAHHFLSRALKIADAVNFIFLLGHLLQPVAQLSVADVQERNRIARDRIHSQLALKFAEILFQIAAVFDTEGKMEDAQSTYLQALAALEISGVGSGLAVVQTLSALAMLLYSEGHYGDSLAYAEKALAILLENYPTMKVVVQQVTDVIRVILHHLRTNGYTLLRHPDSRHRFTTYV